jgi:hypothetical protein
MQLLVSSDNIVEAEGLAKRHLFRAHYTRFRQDPELLQVRGELQDMLPAMAVLGADRRFWRTTRILMLVACAEGPNEPKFVDGWKELHPLPSKAFGQWEVPLHNDLQD